MKYISSIFSTGAVRETPSKVISKILSELTKNENVNILEFGAGKGEITKSIVQIFNNCSYNYFAFEIDEKFSSILRDTSSKIQVFSQDAFHFEKKIPVNFKADYIICSMPLSFYNKSELTNLLSKMKNTLNKNGKILILFHAFWMIPYLKKQLPHCIIYRFNTFPLYYLLSYE